MNGFLFAFAALQPCRPSKDLSSAKTTLQKTHTTRFRMFSKFIYLATESNLRSLNWWNVHERNLVSNHSTPQKLIDLLEVFVNFFRVNFDVSLTNWIKSIRRKCSGRWENWRMRLFASGQFPDDAFVTHQLFHHHKSETFLVTQHVTHRSTSHEVQPWPQPSQSH